MTSNNSLYPPKYKLVNEFIVQVSLTSVEHFYIAFNFENEAYLIAGAVEE